jgi:hypothetical protein
MGLKDMEITIPLTANRVSDWLRCLHDVNHPSYSSDLAMPNYFHLSGPLNKHMADMIFARGRPEAKRHLTQIYSTPVFKPWKSWRNKCPHVNNDYLEAWNVTPAAPMSHTSNVSTSELLKQLCKWFHSPTVLKKCKIPTKHVTRKTQCYGATTLCRPLYCCSNAGIAPVSRSESVVCVLSVCV